MAANIRKKIIRCKFYCKKMIAQHTIAGDNDRKNALYPPPEVLLLYRSLTLDKVGN